MLRYARWGWRRHGGVPGPSVQPRKSSRWEEESLGGLGRGGGGGGGGGGGRGGGGKKGKGGGGEGEGGGGGGGGQEPST